MAALAITERTSGPPDSGRRFSKVRSMVFTGDGTSAVEVAAGVSGSFHMITGGVTTSQVAGVGASLLILSNSTEIGREQLGATETHAHMVAGTYTEAGEALNIKLSASKAVWGTIEFVTIPANKAVGLRLGDMTT